MISLLFVLVTTLIQIVVANVEKTIFVAPDHLTVPKDASIDKLLLTPLNPDRLKFRTHLNASFPTDEKPHGEDTWALLEGLTPGQRYELRVCWLATQPTAFWIYTHSLNSVFESANLITSLSIYSYARQAQLSSNDIENLQKERFVSTEGKDTSMLFLQIQAAADYFSLNRTLMEQVPPVHVDLILDPYLFNIVPQSLIPTAVYIVITAVFAWFLSGWAIQQLTAYLARSRQEIAKQEKKSK